MKYSCILKDTITGRVIETPKRDYDLLPNFSLFENLYRLQYYIHEGNMSCDCNRADYFEEYKQTDNECGESKFICLGIKVEDKGWVITLNGESLD